MRFPGIKYLFEYSYKKIAWIFFFLLLFQCAAAHHIKGGWIGYKYTGVGSYPGTSFYEITVYMYGSCTEAGPTEQVVLGIFDGISHQSLLTQTIRKTSSRTLTKKYFSPCLTNPPDVCYEVYTYTTTLELANNDAGYVLSAQQAFRVDNILNVANSGSSGITFTASIPGIISNEDYHTNSSPVFISRDTAIICKSSFFSLPFSATDLIDGDSLSYSFGNGLNAINPSDNSWSTTPKPPPYPSLEYINGYTGASPMGDKITVNPRTGLISGTTPADTGEYVIAVYVKEWRNGILLDSVKKELQIIVTDCSLISVGLEQSYVNCTDYSVSFKNLSAVTGAENFDWDFGVNGINSDVSKIPEPTYTYPDTGTYTVKLHIIDQSGCSDSARSTVKIYPGFSPGFRVAGSCYQSPFIFTDTSSVRYGVIDTRSWDFGDPSTSADVSSMPSPDYTYAAPGTANVTLNVTSSKGCSASITKTVTMSDKPDIILPFTDTLICSADSLRLFVSTTSAASFQWSPNYNILNATTPSPVVYPKDTTVYKIVLRDKACIDSATVTVNVLDFIDVQLPADTTICRTDTIQLSPVSNALKYVWSPSAGLADANVKYPKAAPLQNTLYNLAASLGTCKASGSILVKTVAYPVVNAGPDRTICFGKSAQLQGSTNGSSFTWQLQTALQNGNTLTPLATPDSSIVYILSATDTLGCPKPATDSVWVTVIPTIKVQTLTDTIAVINQPLQLQTTATADNLNYSWSPGNWLSSSSDQSPVFKAQIFTSEYLTYVVTATDANGCGTTDTITIRLFNTDADIFMPSAFSPNGDGRNDIFKPLTAGVTLQYFIIYDRWGKNLFYSTSATQGWDGTFKGKAQTTGTYVWMARGITYGGRAFVKKGTVVLVR
ncbi:MAG: PKD domain-containing protein [Ferruginibacter sp.]